MKPICPICNKAGLKKNASHCDSCWKIVEAGYAHVEKTPPDYIKQFPAWHGWAVREAFISGAKFQMYREKPLADPSE